MPSLAMRKTIRGIFRRTTNEMGISRKNFKSQYRKFQIDVSRDRNREFEPKLIPKYQRDISGIEEQVISLYNVFILYNRVDRSVTPVIKNVTSVTDLFKCLLF